MFHRSCHLIKSVSPQTAHQADTLGCAIKGLFNGYSQRQLHGLVHSLFRDKGTIGIRKYNCLHKVCICPTREFVWYPSFSQKKNADTTQYESGKENEIGSVTPLANIQQQIWSKGPSNQNSENGSIKVNDKDNISKESDKDPKNDNIARGSFHDNKISHQGVGKDGNSSEGNNEQNEHEREVRNIFHENHDKNEKSPGAIQNSLLDRYGGSTAEDRDYNAAQTENEGYLSAEENEAVKAANEIKIQKGKSSNILLTKAKNLLRKSSKQDQQSEASGTGSGSAKTATNMPPPPRKRPSVDLNKCSTERNFITPVRAMTDFLLKPSDLEGLRKTKRRSPYENDPPITVYWRKDVEAKAIDVWGSKENLLKEILKRDIERRRYQQNIFTVKRRLRDYRREQGRETEFNSEQNGLRGTSGKVVLTAIFINGGNTVCKFGAWWYTGSHSMFAEAIHSLADTINQLILAYGIHKSVQRANSDHPYGYTNMRYVSSLISGVGIFCVGSGLSFYHGIVGLADPTPVESYYYAFLTLAFSLITEGATLLIAFNSIRQGAKNNEMKVSEYILRGSDPSVSVILLEDTAAVIGVLLAGGTMGLSAVYESHVPDAIGSLLVCGLLAVVATFIIYTNVAALVGRSIPQERLDKINAELESDVMIRAIHDVKGIDMGNSLVRYKAEMDFDGGELTRSYLDKQDLNQMLEVKKTEHLSIIIVDDKFRVVLSEQEVKKFTTIDELEEFMLKHGENIVDMMGGEIDRIELKLRKKHPEIRHCDLEIL